MSEGLREFASRNRLRVKNDGCGEPIIQGKYGHIYEHSNNQFGVCIEHPVGSSLGVRLMRNKMRVLDHLGLERRQRGDSEGIWVLPQVFGSWMPLYAQILKIVGIRKIRKPGGRPFAKRGSK